MTTLEKRRRYTNEEIEHGLITLARLGSPLRASEETGIPKTTLIDWRDQHHADRYQEIHASVLPAIQARMAQGAEIVVQQATALEIDILTKLSNAQLEDKDLGPTLQRVSTTKGINAEKALLLRGQPTSIVENRDMDGLVRKLKATGLVAIDSTAEEVEDAELPPASPATDAQRPDKRTPTSDQDT